MSSADRVHGCTLPRIQANRKRKIECVSHFEELEALGKEMRRVRKKLPPGDWHKMLVNAEVIVGCARHLFGKTRVLQPETPATTESDGNDN